MVNKDLDHPSPLLEAKQVWGQKPAKCEMWRIWTCASLVHMPASERLAWTHEINMVPDAPSFGVEEIWPHQSWCRGTTSGST